MSRLLPYSDANKPLPVSTVPRFYWPSQRGRTPTHCGHCGARLLRNDVPTSEHPLTDVACLMCSRVACELVLDGLRQMTPAEFKALPHVRSGGPKPIDPANLPTCCDCGERPATRRWRLCDDCLTARQKADALRRAYEHRARQRAGVAT